MRPSLLPGLIAAARRNLDRGAATVRLFEIGRRYLADAERPTLGLVLAGERAAARWQTGKAQPFDAFDAKAEALALLEAAGAPVETCRFSPDAWRDLASRPSATLRLGPKTIVAAFGELHPGLQKSLDAPAGAVAAELYLDAIPASAVEPATRAPPMRRRRSRRSRATSPSSSRPSLPRTDLLRAIRGADKKAITGAPVRPVRGRRRARRSPSK